MQDYPPVLDMAPTVENGARVTRRVCDQCRLRKVRCNRVQPCSNCVVANHVCAFTGAGRKFRQPQNSGAPTVGHNKIEEVESRLCRVESLLSDLCERLASKPNMASSTNQTNTPQVLEEAENTLGNIRSQTSTPSGASLCFADEPILANQRTFANNFLENAVRESSLPDISIKMQNALADLRQIVELQNSHSIHDEAQFPLQCPMPDGKLTNMPMPPLETVVHVWSRLKDGPPSFFLSLCSLVGVTEFPALCRLVYFPSADFSEATFITVNIGLYYMFSEQEFLTSQGERDGKYEEYIRICQQNLETGLSNLRLFSIATTESLVALILGTIYAIDHSRPAVAWTLNCTAAQMCQTEAFHRFVNAKPGQESDFNIKSIALWHIYTMDKSLGLRLGRAPVLHEWDIVMPRDMHVPGASAVSGMLMVWFKLATLQGKIYSYSKSALASPQQELIARACKLAEECQALEIEASRARHDTMESLETMQASPLIGTLIRGDEVQLLSTMTLVYRAIPPADGNVSTFSSDCIDTARKAMRKHQDSMRIIGDQRFFKMSYAHWNLLLLPFSPFFVLFCHVIETSSKLDLQLISDFASSLEHFVDISSTTEKLWRLCGVMSSVAATYVQAKSHLNDENERPESKELNEYLGQLGFMAGNELTGGIMNDDVSWNMQAVQINDWFCRSRNMMNLLQEDLSELGTQ